MVNTEAYFPNRVSYSKAARDYELSSKVDLIQTASLSVCF